MQGRRWYRRVTPLVLLILLSLVAGCRPGRHDATGQVVEIDVAGTHVTIDHDEIPGIMPAMRMRFPVRDPSLLDGVTPGAAVRFELTRRADHLTVTDLAVTGGPPRPRPGTHDHAPHHGGVVTMVGLRHLEALAARDGRVLVYLSDAWRRPLPAEGWTGDVVLGSRTVALRPAAGALAGHGDPLEGRDVLAHVRLIHADEAEPLEAHLILPLESGAAGAAVAPERRCGAGESHAATGPRCTLRFGQPITALAAVPGTSHVVLGIQNAGVSVWDVATGSLVRAFEPAPALEVDTPGAPHPEIVDALDVSPDGRQTLVASEGRLLRYATASGRLLRVLPAPAPLLRRIVWHPDGASAVVYAAYGAQAWRVQAADGQPVSWYAATARVTAIAIVDGGRRVVVGDERGAVLAFAAAAASRGRPVAQVPPPVRGLAAGGGLLAIATGAGTVEVVDLAGTLPPRRSAPASPCYRLAAAPPGQGGGVACAAFDRRIRIHPLEALDAPVELAWHESLVTGLAWTGAALVSADGDGGVAVWGVSKGASARAARADAR